MPRFAVIVGVSALAACSPPDYGAPSESTVIIKHYANHFLGKYETNIAIFGTQVRYAAGPPPLRSEVATIPSEDVAAIIDELELVDFLDREDERGCHKTDQGGSTVTVRLAVGEHSVQYGCDSDLNQLNDRIEALSGYSTWLSLR